MEHLLIDTSLTVAAAIKAYFFFGLGLNKKEDQMRIDAKVNEYFEKRKDIVKTRSSIKLGHISIGTLYYKKLETLKSEFLDFYFTEVIKNKKEIKTNEQVDSKIDEYMLKIMKLRMIVEPSIQIATNVHTQSKITYLIAKSFWYNEDGIKVRKFTKSLGRAEENKNGNNDINAKVEADIKIKEIMVQAYNDEYGE